jgi:HD-GYP domain-containing protein (c-di-GMP phosphodiesterase class II)
MGVGMAALFREVRARVAEKFRDEIVTNNAATAEAVIVKLSELISTKIEYRDTNWELAQSVIESLRLPAGGFACMIDESGALLCHPDMRDDPSLRGVQLGRERIEPFDGAAPREISSLPGDGVTSGTVTFGGIDTHYLATAELPGLGARLLVHQPLNGLLTAGEAATSGLLWLALGTGGVVLLCTGIATFVLVRRHDRELEEINTGLEAEVHKRVDQAMSFRDALIFGLAKLADYRDTDTGAHLERIAEYSEALARELAQSSPEIDEAYVRCLRVASAMHDIGKVGVEDAVLLKPGKLTDAERARIQRHPIMGADTLMAIRRRLGHDDLVEMSIVVALEHHERWDGNGYPLKLAGEEIQLPARIVALADVYDALTSERVYKAAMSHAEAKAIIVNERGKQFDPAVVEAFVRVDREFDAIRTKHQAVKTPKAAARAA